LGKYAKQLTASDFSPMVSAQQQEDTMAKFITEAQRDRKMARLDRVVELLRGECDDKRIPPYIRVTLARACDTVKAASRELEGIQFDDRTDENIYGLASVRQSIEEDRR
jgi:hypothetical protein